MLSDTWLYIRPMWISTIRPDKCVSRIRAICFPLFGRPDISMHETFLKNLVFYCGNIKEQYFEKRHVTTSSKSIPYERLKLALTVVFHKYIIFNARAHELKLINSMYNVQILCMYINFCAWVWSSECVFLRVCTRASNAYKYIYVCVGIHIYEFIRLINVRRYKFRNKFS